MGAFQFAGHNLPGGATKTQERSPNLLPVGLLTPTRKAHHERQEHDREPARRPRRQPRPAPRRRRDAPMPPPPQRLGRRCYPRGRRPRPYPLPALRRRGRSVGHRRPHRRGAWSPLCRRAVLRARARPGHHGLMSRAAAIAVAEERASDVALAGPQGTRRPIPPCPSTPSHGTVIGLW